MTRAAGMIIGVGGVVAVAGGLLFPFMREASVAERAVFSVVLTVSGVALIAVGWQMFRRPPA